MPLTGNNRSPMLGEILGGGALVAIVTGAILFAVQWGGTLARVEDHVDPEKHGLIVLAGNLETGQKIAVIETEIGHVKDAVEANRVTANEVKDEVADIKSDIRLILELNRRVLARPPAAVAAPAQPVAPD